MVLPVHGCVRCVASCAALRQLSALHATPPLSCLFPLPGLGDEVEEALAAGDREHAAEEVGDLLFAVTNLARTLKADPEQCLRATNAKFERRFRHVEAALSAKDVPLRRAGLEAMEGLWQAAKVREAEAAESPLTSCSADGGGAAGETRS